MIQSGGSVLKYIVFILSLFTIAYILYLTKTMMVNEEMFDNEKNGNNRVSTTNSTSFLELPLATPAPSLDILCSERFLVFCGKFGYQFDKKEVIDSISLHKDKGWTRNGNRFNDTRGLKTVDEENQFKNRSGAGLSNLDDPYFKINRKLQSGQQVVVHVINPQRWMVNDWNMFRCHVNACVFDMDRVTEKTDVVVVHGVRLSENQFPEKRWSGQIYVMMGRESPLHYQGVIVKANSSWRYAFNLTATYRRDSDILFSYGGISYTPENSKTETKKSRLVAWMVSNCKAPSLRYEYVQEMKKFIQIDIYGDCGYPIDCPRPDYGLCMDDTLQHYKFYLAFENSMCPDYVTEKFFKLFFRKLNLVPVVRGGADYDRYFPAGTFINAAWFRTAKDLAFYLKHMTNETYSRYLKQIRQFREASTPFILCDVCDAVLLQRSTPKIYDIKTWLDQPCPVTSFI